MYGHRRYRMPLPPITHLQFLLLSLLSGFEKSGRELRHELARNGVNKSAPAFYQLMARLETQGLAEGWYVPIEVGDQTVRERRYRLTGLGEKAIREAYEFYLKQAKTDVKAMPQGVPAHAT
jgi:DNA-binding PadR family transcriptional regulator